MRCSKPKTLIVFTGCALWVAVLGWIDDATGYELGSTSATGWSAPCWKPGSR